MIENKLEIKYESSELAETSIQENSVFTIKYRKVRDLASSTKKLVTSNLFLTIFGFIFTYILIAFASVFNSFPGSVIFSLILLEIIFSLLIMIFSTKNLQFTSSKLLFSVGGPLVALVRVCLDFESNLTLACQIPLITLVLSYVIQKIYKGMKKETLLFSYEINFSRVYHNHKIIGLWVSLIAIFITFSFIFYTEPQHLAISAFLVITFTLLFSKKKSQKTLLSEKRNSNRFQSSTEYQNLRPVTLVSIFLVCMPLIFAIGSIAPLNTPQFQFATASQSSRINNNIDFTGLDYFDNLDVDAKLEKLVDKKVRQIINTKFK